MRNLLKSLTIAAVGMGAVLTGLPVLAPVGGLVFLVAALAVAVHAAALVGVK